MIPGHGSTGTQLTTDLSPLLFIPSLDWGDTFSGLAKAWAVPVILFLEEWSTKAKVPAHF